MADLDSIVAKAQAACDQGWWPEAQALLEELYAADYRPDFIAQQLGDVCANQGKVADSVRWHRQAIALEPLRYRCYENLIFTLDAQAATTDAEATAARRDWWHALGAPAYAMRQPHRNWWHPEKRLRVGYVSGDWNFHSAAIAWAGVVSKHTDAIEPVLYSTLEKTRYDNRTALWQGQFGGHFVDVSAMSAHELALTIQHDQIDILVDLSGYTNNNRLLTFAYKPAPIQIEAWGYVLGTASPMIDVIFADPVVAPPSVRAQLAERVVDLPALLTYHPPSKATGCPADLPMPDDPPCLTKPPVFSVFQRAMKISDESLAAWRTLLERLPDARIMFKGADYVPARRTRIADAFGDCRNRITFDFNTWHYDHMLWYQDVDLALDPWPQTGGVSTLEALWMGVPTVTLLGARMIQRASASFLTILGLQDFIATTEADYIERAIAFVTTRKAELAAIRKGLRLNMAASPIMRDYVPAVEGAYRQLWYEECAKRKAQAA